MSPLADAATPQAPPVADLATAIQQVLQASPEPLTPSKIRAALPAAHRSVSPEDLTEALRRLVAANVLVQYPRYRSQQDRFWDRPMEVHVVSLIETALGEGALPWSELRRKLPAYAQVQAEGVLNEHIRQGRVHRHPRAGRMGERYGLQPPHPRDYLRDELRQVIQRLERLGFQQAQIREAAIELLHEEEWASPQAEENAAATESRSQEAAQPGESMAGATEHPPEEEAGVRTPPATLHELHAEHREAEQPHLRGQ